MIKFIYLTITSIIIFGITTGIGLGILSSFTSGIDSTQIAGSTLSGLAIVLYYLITIDEMDNPSEQERKAMFINLP